jgi:hypothetical protein
VHETVRIEYDVHPMVVCVTTARSWWYKCSGLQKGCKADLGPTNIWTITGT